MKAFQYFTKAGRKAENVQTEQQAEQFQQRGEEALSKYWIRFVLIGALFPIVLLPLIFELEFLPSYQEGLTEIPWPREMSYEPWFKQKISKILFVSIFFVYVLAVPVFLVSVARMLNVWIQKPRFKPKWNTVLIAFVMAVAPILAFWGGIMSATFLGLFGRIIVWMLVGSLHWLVWSDRGWAGDFTSLGHKRLKNPRLHGELALLGAIAGGTIFWIIHFIIQALKVYFQIAASFLRFPYTFLMLVMLFCTIFAAAGFVIGNTLFSFARPNIPLGTRLRRWMPGLIVGAATVVLSLILYYGIAVGRYDYGRSLVEVTGIPPSTHGRVMRYSFTSGEADIEISALVQTDWQTLLSFVRENEKPIISRSLREGDRSEIQKIWEHLARRNYKTAHLARAINEIREFTFWNWDVLYQLQTHQKISDVLPHHSRWSLRWLFNTLARCAVSPENLQVLDKLADENRYVYTTSTYQKMADLYWRFGQREKAFSWYQKAKLPPAEMEGLRTRKLPFISGKVTGKITIDSEPGAGAEVGLFTWKTEEKQRIRIPDIVTGTTTDQNGNFH